MRRGRALWDSACWGQRTHRLRAIVVLAQTIALWRQFGSVVAVLPASPAQVVVQQFRACATEHARRQRWGIPSRNVAALAPERSKKISSDL